MIYRNNIQTYSSATFGEVAEKNSFVNKSILALLFQIYLEGVIYKIIYKKKRIIKKRKLKNSLQLFFDVSNFFLILFKQKT